MDDLKNTKQLIELALKEKVEAEAAAQTAADGLKVAQDAYASASDDEYAAEALTRAEVAKTTADALAKKAAEKVKRLQSILDAAAQKLEEKSSREAQPEKPTAKQPEPAKPAKPAPPNFEGQSDDDVLAFIKNACK